MALSPSQGWLECAERPRTVIRTSSRPRLPSEMRLPVANSSTPWSVRTPWPSRMSWLHVWLLRPSVFTANTSWPRSGTPLSATSLRAAKPAASAPLCWVAPWPKAHGSSSPYSAALAMRPEYGSAIRLPCWATA